MSDIQPVNHKGKTLLVRRYIDVEQASKDASINTVDLTGAMMEQASLFAHYGVLHAKCLRQVEDFKTASEAVAAMVYRKLRDKAVSDGEKPTEAQLKAQVDTDRRVRNVRRALNEAKQIEAHAKIIVESFRHRRDMLIQIGSTAREELKGEIKIAARNEQDEGRKSMQERMLSRQKNRLADTQAAEIEEEGN